jgi:hypothetical protein
MEMLITERKYVQDLEVMQVCIYGRSITNELLSTNHDRNTPKRSQKATHSTKILFISCSPI